MKIYPKTGDKGITSLLSGERVSKYSDRVNAYGSADELNSIIGIAISFLKDIELKQTLSIISNDIFSLCSDLSNSKVNDNTALIIDKHIEYLENKIDNYSEKLPPLKQFILPGGGKAAAFIHQARSMCRHTERLTIKLAENENTANSSIIYLNRLSDFLFVAARYSNYIDKIDDALWKK